MVDDGDALSSNVFCCLTYRFNVLNSFILLLFSLCSCHLPLLLSSYFISPLNSCSFLYLSLLLDLPSLVSPSSTFHLFFALSPSFLCRFLFFPMPRLRLFRTLHCHLFTLTVLHIAATCSKRPSWLPRNGLMFLPPLPSPSKRKKNDKEAQRGRGNLTVFSLPNFPSLPLLLSFCFSSKRC